MSGRHRQLVQPAAQRNQGPAVEAGTDLAGTMKLTRAIIVAEQQRAEPEPAAARLGEANDDEVLGLGALCFEPGIAPRPIDARSALRDDALQPHVAGASVES